MCSGHLFRLILKGCYKTKKDGNRTQDYLIIKDKEEYARMIKDHPSLDWKLEQIPCGICLECRLKNAKEWAFRCMKEAKEHDSNLMLTLTYSDEYLPKGIKPLKINKETGEVLEYEMTNVLWKKEHQLFLKKLRKWWDTNIIPKERPKKKKLTEFQNYEEYKKYKKEYDEFWEKWGLKYRLCGEYGSDAEYKDWKGNIRKGTKRPHFHIIVFGLEIADMKFHKYSYCEWDKEKKNELYKSKTLDKLWGKGLALINEVNWETCAYVSRYIMKKQLGKGGKEYYEENGLTPEYSASSNRPGIGNSYFYNNIEKFKNDEKHFVATKKGIQEIGSIRYYDKLMEKEFPEEYEKIKEKRRKRSIQIMEKILKDTSISESKYIDNKARKIEKKTKKLIRPLV